MPGAPSTAPVLPRCPDCGGLECLCRPRFFAGELLTEEELNRLDHYIVEKNKLHNRYLHGWGVVCGLDVVCDECGKGVTVRPGYALSPCGEDIIVCRAAPVDVCTLINACRKEARRQCDPAAAAPADGCTEATQQWVLAIRYKEIPSRGITPLHNTATTCGCGGAGNGGGNGCGCGKQTKSNAARGAGGSATVRTSTSAVRCAPPPECEPTLICEGFDFEVYKLPATDVKQGAMAARFLVCLTDLVAAIPPFPQPGANPQALHDWCCQTRDGLLDYAASHSSYDCSLQQQVQDLVCPDPTDQDFQKKFEVAWSLLLRMLVELVFGCLCSALMPPCPEPVTADRVPLALVTVTGAASDCRVQGVCNWTTQRKYATTFPSLQYWLSVLPFGRWLREALARFCCSLVLPYRLTTGALGTVARGAAGAPIREDSMGTATPPPGGEPPASAFHASTATTARTREFLRLTLEALAARGRSMDTATVVRTAFGEGAEQAPQGEALFDTIVLDQMAKPALRGFAPGAAAAVAAAAGAFAAAGPEAGPTVAAQIRDLQETVRKQQATIDELKSKRRNA